MSIPTEPQTVTVTIALTANQAVMLVKDIQCTLDLAREAQAKRPELHWNLESMSDTPDRLTFYSVTTPLRIAGHEEITFHIVPDKRHEGCSGYCHY